MDRFRFAVPPDDRSWQKGVLKQTFSSQFDENIQRCLRSQQVFLLLTFSLIVAQTFDFRQFGEKLAVFFWKKQETEASDTNV